VIVLGIDPGTRHLGWGVIDVTGTRMVHVAHGVVNTETDTWLGARLCEIDDALLEVIERYDPAQAAVESLFFAKDAQAASKLGHARGVVLLRLARGGIPTFEYAPAKVKQMLAGRGAADKRQVGMMVKTLLGLRDLPRADATDALAIAIAHAHIARVDGILRARRVSRT
jgi:crossover junction endodeoxyribonuclease RuvC